MQRTQLDDEFRHAGLRSDPLIPNPTDRCCDQAVHAPKRLQQLHLLTEAGNREARRLLRQAIAMDPRFGLAKALAAMSVSLAVDQRWIERGSEEAIEAVALARSSMVDAPGDASVLRLAGYTIAFVGFDVESGRVATDRAVALNANSAPVLGRQWLAAHLAGRVRCCPRKLYESDTADPTRSGPRPVPDRAGASTGPGRARRAAAGARPYP